MDFIINRLDDILIAISAVVTAASALSALTPTPKDDSVVSKIKSAVDVLALNIGNARKKGV